MRRPGALILAECRTSSSIVEQGYPLSTEPCPEPNKSQQFSSSNSTYDVPKSMSQHASYTSTQNPFESPKTLIIVNIQLHRSPEKKIILHSDSNPWRNLPTALFSSYLFGHSKCPAVSSHIAVSIPNKRLEKWQELASECLLKTVFIPGVLK